MHDVLVIVPCGSSKIWSKQPDCGPIAAADAYIGTPFKLNREYAECFGGAWVVLSAKYGFVLPEFEIPESYEVTFKRPSTRPVNIEVLERQVVEMHLIAIRSSLASAALPTGRLSLLHSPRAPCTSLFRSPASRSEK